jgi:WD40 repeat protein
VNSAVFSPDSSQVLTASDDRTAKLWDVKSGNCMMTFTGHEHHVVFAIFSSDSENALTAGDKTARLWEVKSGKCVKTFEGHGGYVYSAVFSPDSNQVLTASFDQTAKL